MDKSSVSTENVKIEENRLEKSDISSNKKSLNWKSLKIHTIVQEICIKYVEIIKN